MLAGVLAPTTYSYGYKHLEVFAQGVPREVEKYSCGRGLGRWLTPKTVECVTPALPFIPHHGARLIEKPILRANRKCLK